MTLSFAFPAPVEFLLTRLESRGYSACVVGGCVRDLLRGAPPADWDVATSALPEQVWECFPEFPVLDTGPAFGGVTAVLPSGRYEITTFRRDGVYSDRRRPDSVRFSRSIEEDLARRDFTVNAMACRLDRTLIDPFGGEEDLKNRRIRCVGDSQRRFREDSLRILRCLRFSATLGFSVVSETAAALREQAGSLSLLARERILQEWTKLLSGLWAAPVLDAFPEIFFVLLPECPSAPSAEIWAALPPEPALRMADLLLPLPEDLRRRVVARFRYSSDEARRILFFCRSAASLSPGAVPLRRLLSEAPSDDVRLAVRLRFRGDAKEQTAQLALLDEILCRGDCCRLCDLAVTGDDLLPMGFSGPEIGRLLHRLLEAVLTDRLPNRREELLNFCRNSGI